MEVRVKLFATLARHLADVKPGTPFEVALCSGATVEDLVEKLDLPRDQVKVVFVNGRARPMDWFLESGDEVGIFPPIGGG